MSEFTKLGGYLIEGQPEVAHDNTLSGNGLEGSPLGLSEQVSEVNDLVHSNSGAWNGVSTKLDTTAFSDVSGSFLTAVPEGYATTADLTGKQDTLTFGYNESNAISSINESAIAGGSAPTYGYTDNGWINSIDTSGLYATSAGAAATANLLRVNGTMGGNIVQSSGNNSFYYMPLLSPWTTADVATGIFAPLQYSTGACLGMQSNDFRAYFKGNEWFVSNKGIGQALRGEVHAARGVHISGATTAGYGFNLGIKSVSGVNATGSWKYGHDEDAALRAVSSCDMHESAFSYDASDNITGYNGSAFKAGDEFPQSATEVIETVTANSADWKETTETVSSNSGAWGGSALPISAGPGIKLEMNNGTLVASTKGYVWQSASLFHTDTPVKQTIYTLSDDCSNYDKLEVDFYDINNWRTVMDCPIPPNLAASGTRGGYFSVVPESTATGSDIWFKAFNWTAANTTWSCYCSEIAAKGGSTTQTVNANQPDNPPKVVNIIGWKRVGGN